MILNLYMLSLSVRFSHINNEEMELNIKHDFITLNGKLKLENSMKKEVAKRWMGWPKKQIEFVFEEILIFKKISTLFLLLSHYFDNDDEFFFKKIIILWQSNPMGTISFGP